MAGVEVRPWQWLLGVTILSAIAIVVLGPHHNDLQLAGSADAFRRLLVIDGRDQSGRHIAAAVADVVFAAAYGRLGFAVVQALRDPPQRLANAGATLLGLGAIFDELENAVLIRNIVGRRTLTDGWVDAMQYPGTVKWIGGVGVVILTILVVVDVVGRRR